MYSIFNDVCHADDNCSSLTMELNNEFLCRDAVPNFQGSGKVYLYIF